MGCTVDDLEDVRVRADGRVESRDVLTAENLRHARRLRSEARCVPHRRRARLPGIPVQERLGERPGHHLQGVRVA